MPRFCFDEVTGVTRRAALRTAGNGFGLGAIYSNLQVMQMTPTDMTKRVIPFLELAR